MKTKEWLQTATVGLGKAKEEFPFTYFFLDSGKTGSVVVFVNEKEDNGGIDVYKLYTKFGLVTKEFNVSPEYIVEIKDSSEKNVNNETEDPETLEETSTRHPPESKPPKREMPPNVSMFV